MRGVRTALAYKPRSNIFREDNDKDLRIRKGPSHGDCAGSGTIIS